MKNLKLMIDYERGGRQKDSYDESEVINVPCPLCSRNEYEEIYREMGSLVVVQCMDCGLLYVNPRLKNPEEVYHGDTEAYFKEARLIFEAKAPHHRDKNYLDDLKLIHRYKPKGNFLDVGTNMGFFLRNAKKMGYWDIYGVEPSPSLSEMARKYFGLNVKTAFLENAGFENDFFDVVTMTDVFEHITDPRKILKEIHRILRKDGILFIKVPNGLFNLFKFHAAKALKGLKNYNIFDSYEHVVHYSDMTLRLMLERSGFKLIRNFIGRPIQLPVWQRYVGHFYQYPTPWVLDYKRQSARMILYWLSLIEFRLRLNKIGYFAPNIIAIARKI
ncbi:MAG: methyltransferase domain-containing protein [Candidatus Omnitrophota bacterium]